MSEYLTKIIDTLRQIEAEEGDKISAVSAAVRSKNEFTNRTSAAATVWIR